MPFGHSQPGHIRSRVERVFHILSGSKSPQTKLLWEVKTTNPRGSYNNFYLKMRVVESYRRFSHILWISDDSNYVCNLDGFGFCKEVLH